MFVEGLARACSQMTFLYMVPDSFIVSGADQNFSARSVWGLDGTSLFAPLRQRRETFFTYVVAGALSPSAAKPFHAYAGPAMERHIRTAIGCGPDLIFVDQLQTMMPVLAVRPRAPILLDLADMVHLVRWRAARQAPAARTAAVIAAQVPALVIAENRSVRFASCTTVCSDDDRRSFALSGARKRTVVVRNAVAMPKSAPSLPKAQTLLFLGNYAYEPNLQAVDRLLRRIWPIVHRTLPMARLLLAGSGIERIPCPDAPLENVDRLGFVDDLALLYASARVICCPLDVGGGTRVKLIEAASYGRPIVSTHVGAEGLNLVDGTEILLRDADDELAAGCCWLLQDDQKAGAMGTAARSRVRRLYDVENVRSQVTSLATKLLSQRAAT